MTLENNKLKEIKPVHLNKQPLIQVKNPPNIKKIKVIDLFQLLSGYSFSRKYKGRTKVSNIKLYNENYVTFGWMTRKKPVLLKRFIRVGSKDFYSLCRILGFYIAEVASSTPETTKSRLGATIASSNKKLLKQIQKDYYCLFKNVKSSIIMSIKKTRPLYNGVYTVVCKNPINAFHMGGLYCTVMRRFCPIIPLPHAEAWYGKLEAHSFWDTRR